MILVVVEFQLRADAQDKFERALEKLHARIKRYDGFPGEEPCQAMSDSTKFVTLFRFKNRDAVEAWRNDEVHLEVQALGKREVFAWYRITVANVERDYEFDAMTRSRDSAHAEHSTGPLSNC